MVRNTSLNLLISKPDKKKINRQITFVNPNASDENLAIFAQAFMALSDNQLKKVQKVQQYDYEDFYIRGTSDDDWLEVGDQCTVLSDGGNDTLVFGDDIRATVADFNLSDCISLASAVNEATFEDGVLTLGGIKLKLQGVAQIDDFAAMIVYNGGTQTTLGNLLQPVADDNDVDAYLDAVFNRTIIQNVDDADFNAYMDGIFGGGIIQTVSDSDFNSYFDGIFAG